MAFGEMKSDGNELLSNCKAFIDLASLDSKIKSNDLITIQGSGKCVGLLQGVSKMNRWYEIYLKNQTHENPLFCIPDGVTLGQKTLVVIKYLTEYPELLHEPDTVLIIKAFMQAFPCK
jgi:hypothetical protein